MDCKIVPAVDTKYNKHLFARTPEIRGWQKILDFRFMMTLLYFNTSSNQRLGECVRPKMESRVVAKEQGCWQTMPLICLKWSDEDE